jgi:hypothetical protein
LGRGARGDLTYLIMGTFFVPPLGRGARGDLTYLIILKSAVLYHFFSRMLQWYVFRVNTKAKRHKGKARKSQSI